MRVLELGPQVYVSGQLFEHDIRLAAKQGVRSIMNNRPDGEAMGQPLSADLAKIAEELGTGIGPVKQALFRALGKLRTRLTWRQT